MHEARRERDLHVRRVRGRCGQSWPVQQARRERGLHVRRVRFCSASTSTVHTARRQQQESVHGRAVHDTRSRAGRVQQARRVWDMRARGVRHQRSSWVCPLLQARRGKVSGSDTPQSTPHILHQLLVPASMINYTWCGAINSPANLSLSHFYSIKTLMKSRSTYRFEGTRTTATQHCGALVWISLFRQNGACTIAS